MLIERDNFIQPIALGLQGTISEVGSLANITGWGITEVKQRQFKGFLELQSQGGIDEKRIRLSCLFKPASTFLNESFYRHLTAVSLRI